MPGWSESMDLGARNREAVRAGDMGKGLALI
jgi:hypothetical protein